MRPTLVNPHSMYRPPVFAAAPPSGWLLLAAAVAPPARGPFVRRAAQRAALLARLAEPADTLRTDPEVREVAVFRAVLIPPVDRRVARPAGFDVVALVETTTPSALERIRTHPALTAMTETIEAASRRRSLLTARCDRLLAPVQHTRDGLFLFNFFAPVDGRTDLEQATRLWEHLAAWYVAETRLTNSTLLAPTEPADFVLINHARFDISLPRLAAAQFLRPSFRSYVQASLRANALTAMPALYRLV